MKLFDVAVIVSVLVAIIQVKSGYARPEDEGTDDIVLDNLDRDQQQCPMELLDHCAKEPESAECDAKQLSAMATTFRKLANMFDVAVDVQEEPIVPHQTSDAFSSRGWFSDMFYKGKDWIHEKLKLKKRTTTPAPKN